ncbi:MAG: hypothetical protein EOO02_16635 [Chitinophagaceae bacterium]|nr:MAG: hypothetical protein EOO02_16635 [Chitinophagaceae bacterium]
MSKLDISVPHSLPRDEAQAKIKNLLASLQQEHKDTIQGVTEEWNGYEGKFSFKVKGMEVAGLLSVEPDHVRLESDLPFMVSFFKDTIANIIKDRAGKLLAN